MTAILGVRTEMTSFWKEHSHQVSNEEMMLDSNADALSRLELPEILSMLPDYKGKDVVELGSGIGRFTGVIADTAKSVIAADFMDSFVEKNKENNGHKKNIKFLQADVVHLELPENSVDIIFTNWLFMYLSDEELQQFFKKALSWLREGGHIFFRESCYHQSGNAKRSSNPTKYRDPATYTALLNMTSMPAGKGLKGCMGYELINSQNVHTYVKLKSNANQITWLAQKVHLPEATNKEYKTFQEFLDQSQYSRNGILRYEKIFGKHFVSTGGKETTVDFVKMLDLKDGQRVYDVGSGIGGSAFYMAEKFGAEVLGIDLSFNMVSISWDRAREINDPRVRFMVADATKFEIPDETFDVVYSRDTILHIPDKAALFKRFLDCLKPGGKLLISDYCCSEGEHSEQFKKYVAQRGYILLSPRGYGEVLEQVGFVNVKAEDKTELFVEVLERELVKTKKIKDSFIEEFSQEDYDAIVGGWQDKVVRCMKGDQRWGLFYAEKPMN